MSKSPPPSSHHSLAEFEEFERLIKENTVVDSDGDEDDSIVSQSTPRKLSDQLAVPADTGYQTFTDITLPMQNGTSSERSEAHPSRSNTDRASVKSSRSSTHKQAFHQEEESMSSDIEDHKSVKSGTDLSCSVEQTHEYPNQSGAEEEGKLVATFGTTEAFEALLKQQLEDDDVSSSNPSDEEPTPIAEERLSSANTTPRVQLPQNRRPKFRSRTARSPAANRARRASQKSKTWGPRSHTQAFPESSDDLSVHSDASRHELRKKLRTERVEREKEKSIKQQLQSEYDDLLTKYAQAENVIDQLRIGAKIDLIAQLPDDMSLDRSGNLIESLPANNSPRSEPILDRHTTPRSSRDAITDSSLKLPATASREFARISLMHQADELRNQMESFAALLDDGQHIADDEKRHVLDNIISSIHKLESDHMKATKDHEASKHAAILTGNASGALLEDFDSDQQIAGQIFQLNSLLEDLKERVAIGSSLPQTPISSRRFVTTDEASDFSESLDNSNIDDRFNQQLKQYNKPVLADEQSDTTVSSHFLSSDEDTTVEYPGRSTSRRNSSRQSDSTVPERFLKRLSSSSISPPKATPRTNVSSADSSPPRTARSDYSQSKTNSEMQHSPDQVYSSCSKLKSRLPIPVASPSPSGRAPSSTRKKSPSSNEMDGDSGFVGSVSSRESMATKSPRTISRKQELSPVLSVPPSERSSASHSRQTHSLKPSTRPRSGSRHSGISAATSAYTRDDVRSESDFIHSKKPTQTSSQTKKPKKKKSLKSEDDSSTWSVPVRPAPPVPFHSRGYNGTSGTPVISSMPFQNEPYRNTPLYESEKSRPSSRRSTASKDSALDMIRGEIAKLRQELLDHQKLADTESTRGRSTERKRQNFAADDQSTEVEYPEVRENSSSRTGRSRRRHSKQGRRSASRGSETDVTVIEKRDAKSGSDAPFNRQSGNAENVEERPRGHWEYVPPYFSPAATSTQIVSPRHVPVPAVVATPLPQPAVVQFEPTFYSTVRYPSPARIYVPVFTSPKVTHQADPNISSLRRGNSLRKYKERAQYRDSSEENDRPLRRSHLRSPVKRSSSVPPLRQSILDPQLSVSLERAERAADRLQHKSRSMYRSLRDSYNKAQLSVSYM